MLTSTWPCEQIQYVDHGLFTRFALLFDHSAREQTDVEEALARRAAAIRRKSEAEADVARLTVEVARLRWRTATARIITANHAKAAAHMADVHGPSQRHGLEHHRQARALTDKASTLETDISVLEKQLEEAREEHKWMITHDLNHLLPLLTAVGVCPPVAHPTATGEPDHRVDVPRVVSREV